ncbi:GTP-binding protein 1-like isoform X1 [Bolinopsis microptera]|uniref:GTP-binding protein 1-like isoform X1 n=1 Tax=Bolinopsis microptera TaxID=2820187 RepID=UPI003079303B
MSNCDDQAVADQALDLFSEQADVSEENSKYALVGPSDEQYEQLLEVLKNRLEDGLGECVYEVGIGDGIPDGLCDEDMLASHATLESLADSLDADLSLLREKQAEEGKVAEVLVRHKPTEEDFTEVRVAVIGNVDAGKSTLLGVLTHGELDNGRGFARTKLFRHKHEQETGRTSSVGNDILGFDSKGGIVNQADTHSSQDWRKICSQSSKVITFIDLAGHEKYLKTTIFGMTGHLPDFGMLMIGANAGIIGMTKEHLGLSLALGVPVYVVVTKIDMCPPNVLEETMKLLMKILKSPGCRKIPLLVSNQDDVVVSATNFTSERICPIFQISNVTGQNMDLLKAFLNLLSVRNNYVVGDIAEFQIDDTYSVPGVGTVISGTCMRGLIKTNDALLMGPDSLGNFKPIIVKSIHRKRLPVKEVRAGQSSSFALKKIKRGEIRKGMVLVSPNSEPQGVWEFESEIRVLHHPTTISVKYQAMVHTGSIRQTASIVTMSVQHMRTGDKAICRFRFIKNPEYIKEGARMVFREGRTKAVGNIIKVYPDAPAPYRGNKRDKMKPKYNARRRIKSLNDRDRIDPEPNLVTRPEPILATVPSIPSVPSVPSIPSVPLMPTIPSVPTIPTIPSADATAAVSATNINSTTTDRDDSGT